MEKLLYTVPSSQRALVGLASPKQSFKIPKLKYETLDYIVNQWSWGKFREVNPPCTNEKLPY